MKVFVAGHRGMLGHVVARYLREQGFAVVTSEARYLGAPEDPLVEAIVQSGCPWVVNALGCIKQKSSQALDLWLGNSLFPAHVVLRLAEGQKMIHASTDCVFSGRQGPYAVDACRDTKDLYGLSKALGELNAASDRFLVIRSSIIGPERGTTWGLMAWFLAQSGQVSGYLDHRWNGITTLEWAKICRDLILGELFAPNGLIQPGCWPPLSKSEILAMIGRIWGHGAVVHPVTSGQSVDRSLVPTHARRPLQDQLEELRHWYGTE